MLSQFSDGIVSSKEAQKKVEDLAQNQDAEPKEKDMLRNRSQVGRGSARVRGDLEPRRRLAQRGMFYTFPWGEYFTHSCAYGGRGFNRPAYLLTDDR